LAHHPFIGQASLTTTIGNSQTSKTKFMLDRFRAGFGGAVRDRGSFQMKLDNALPFRIPTAGKIPTLHWELVSDHGRLTEIGGDNTSWCNSY
jgi:hypothetical protein